VTLHSSNELFEFYRDSRPALLSQLTELAPIVAESPFLSASYGYGLNKAQGCALLIHGMKETVTVKSEYHTVLQNLFYHQAVALFLPFPDLFSIQSNETTARNF